MHEVDRLELGADGSLARVRHREERGFYAEDAHIGISRGAWQLRDYHLCEQMMTAAEARRPATVYARVAVTRLDLLWLLPHEVLAHDFDPVHEHQEGSMSQPQGMGIMDLSRAAAADAGCWVPG